MKNLFHITELKTEKDASGLSLIVTGWYEKLKKKDCVLEAFLDGKKLAVCEDCSEGIRVRLKYLRIRANIDLEFNYRISLPENFRECHSVVLYETENGRRYGLLKLPTRALEQNLSKFRNTRKQKIKEIWLQEGVGGFYRRIWKELGKDSGISYEEYRKYQLTSEEELERQKSEMSAANVPEHTEYPVFYVLLCNAGAERADSALKCSLEQQTYPKWELIENMEDFDAAAERNGYVLAADRNISLSPDAFYQAYKRIAEEPDIDFLYSDEDYRENMEYRKNAISRRKGNAEQRIPDFKPDANEDLLRSRDYIGSFCLVKSELFAAAGGYQGHRYDYHLRCWEKAKKIIHIPRVLIYNLFSVTDVWNEAEAEAGRKALEQYYERCGINAEILLDMEHSFLSQYHTKYQIEGSPLISIIIPNKDHVEDLKKCLDSVLQKSTYSAYEILIVENNSTEERTFSYYGELEKSNDRVKILYWKEGFNYSAINNFAAEQAKGEYLLFLNNDTEVIEPSWMEELLGRCSQQDAGIVGARLFYGDGTIQHAGVIIGMGGLAGHAFGGAAPEHAGYMRFGCTMKDLSAVTAACMMVKRSAFEQAGGFCPKLTVAFNDIDLCLNIRKQGRLVIYNPYVKLYHHESKSRGMEDTPEKVKRFHDEVCLLAKRHPWILKEPDPYYNPNLTIDRNDFTLNERRCEC